MKLQIKNGKKFLVMRYSTRPEKECIQLHSDVLQKYGYCWFGKIGSIPSQRIMNAVYAENPPCMLLYKNEAAYFCKIGEMITSKPTTGYPKYYDSAGIAPSAYIKLLSIDLLSPDILGNCVVVSTGNFVTDTLYHSRIPFLLAEYVYDALPPDSTLQKSKPSIPLGINDCRYRKDGICSYRSCINYQYECDRPSTCAKQKR